MTDRDRTDLRMTDQMADLVDAVADITSGIARLERALLGDVSIGHQGLVARVSDLENLARSAATLHDGIDDRRAVDDTRLGDRMDELATRTHIEFDEIRDGTNRVERKIDRLLWVVLGAGLVTGGGFSYIVQSLTGP